MTIVKNFEEATILVDGKNKWKGKKTMCNDLSDIFINQSNQPENELIADRLASVGYRLANCGSFLEFSPTVSGDKKLVNANFCKVRLCPMCNWRRSKKIFGQVSKIINAINNEKEKEYIFLTLTCKNVSGEDLREQIKILLKSFNRMISDNSKTKKMCQGYFRGLEVTRNNNDGTYHPHIHCILVVNKSYFKSKNYIKQKEWASIWQHYLKVDYIPVVHIEKFKNNNHKAVAEASKYAVKDTDIFLETQEETEKNILILHQALFNIRLIGMGGLFKEWHKKLNLDDADADNVDFINTDNENDNDEVIKDIILRYEWNIGYKNYVLVEERRG